MTRAATSRAPVAPQQPRDRRFPYWFARISRALSQHLLLQVEAEFGLNLAEYRVLNTLADLDSTSIRDIAADASLDKAQVTRAVADLTTRGLVIQVVDGRDRRLRVVTLTTAGRTLIAATVPFVTARQQRLEQRLTAAERRVLWKALAALSDEAERMLKDAARVTDRRRRHTNDEPR
ncbi:MAG: MarR family transcriptional regulator [Rhizobiales bacterium]|nr:MarR family transcriptional regulator [Hyphomicrobiales bacterium]